MRRSGHAYKGRQGVFAYLVFVMAAAFLLVFACTSGGQNETPYALSYVAYNRFTSSS